jgi:putative NADH-flavin reductase
LVRGLAVTGSRLLIVGGAASLVVPGTPGTTVMDDPRYLSPAARHIGETSFEQYRACLGEERVDWAYVSPPADLFAGTGTGAYRLGTDELLVDVDGKSRISIDDLASVVLNEAERPRHHRIRFTAAY